MKTSDLSSVTALLFEVASIQSYVFGSNRLQENIGASHIVSHALYHETLPEVLTEFGEVEMEWEGSDLQIFDRPDLQIEVAYIGGGNALLLAREAKEARRLLQELSRVTLLKYPGLRLLGTVVEGVTREILESDFQHLNCQLAAAIKNVRQSAATRIVPPAPGLVRECPRTGQTALRQNGSPKQRPDRLLPRLLRRPCRNGPRPHQHPTASTPT